MKYCYHIIGFILLIGSSVAVAQPTITSIVPGNNSSNASASSDISITFSEPMNASTLNATSVKVSGKYSGSHPGSYSYNSGNNTLTINPTTNFRAGEVVTVTITKLAKNAGNVAISKGFVSQFSVATGTAISFASATNKNLSLFPNNIGVADFNNDGRMDITMQNNAWGLNIYGLAVGLDNGSGGLNATTYFGSSSIYGIYTTDIDSDGDQDILVKSYGMYLLTNNGTGSFTESSLSVGYGSQYAVTDINGDNLPDIVATLGDNSLKSYTNQGNGTFSSATTLTFNDIHYNFTHGDFDNDGDIDLAVSNQGTTGNSLKILLNDGNSGFSVQNTLEAGSANIDQLQVADLDNNGSLDIAMSNGSALSVFLNNGNAQFQPKSDVSMGGISGRFLTIGDYNGDGYQDLISGNTYGQYAGRFINNGDGTFSSAGIFSTGSTNFQLLSLDFDNDGLLDVVGANQGASTFFVLKGSNVPPQPAPTTAAQNILFSDSDIESFTVSWTSGNGAKRLVLIKAENPVDADPIPYKKYDANSAFGEGDELGLGNYVAYNGTGNTVTITGLEPNTTYHVSVIEYNGSDYEESYLTSSTLIGSEKTLVPDDGAKDTGFGDGGSVVTAIGASIMATVLQPDGKIISAGFKSGNNTSDFYMIRYGTNQLPDPTFGTNGIVETDVNNGSFDVIHTIKLQPDGKILVAGKSDDDFIVARYTKTGVLDQLFGIDGVSVFTFPEALDNQEIAYALAIQKDGKIVVAGRAAGGGFGVARLYATGFLDLDFGTDGKVVTSSESIASANTVAIQSDGKIVVGGSTTAELLAFARYTTTGSLDNTFGTNGVKIVSFGETYQYLSAMEIQSDGKIVGVGMYNASFAAYKLNSNGSPDLTFGQNGLQTIDLGGGGYQMLMSMKLQFDDKIVAVGSTSILVNPGDFITMRLLPTGALDNSFNGDGYDIIDYGAHDIAFSVIIEPKGNILVGGRSAENAVLTRYYNDQPTLPPTDAATNLQFNNVSQTGFVLSWTKGSGEKRIVLVRRGGLINSAPTDLNSYYASSSYGFGSEIAPNTFVVYSDTGATCLVNGLAPGSKYYVAVFEYNGVPAKEKYLTTSYLFGSQSTTGVTKATYSDGSLDESFADGGFTTTTMGSSDAVLGLALQANDYAVTVGWSQLSIAGIRYNTSGNLDNDFSGDGKVFADVGASFSVLGNRVAIQADGKIVMVGTVEQNIVLVRYESNGTLDNTFGTNGVVITDVSSSSDDAGQDIAIQSDGKIVVAGMSDGDFAILRYTDAGILDNTFGTNGVVKTDFGGYDIANGLVIQSDGKIVATGGGDSGDFMPAFVTARYTTAGVLDSGFGTGGKVYTYFGGMLFDRAVDVALLSDGKIILTGYATDNGDVGVVCLNTDGTPFSGFNGTGMVATDLGSDEQANAVAIQKDNRIVIVGSSNSHVMALRYNTDGTLDPGFGVNGYSDIPAGTGYASASDVALQSDNKIVMSVNIDGHFGIMRLGGASGSDETSGSFSNISYDSETTLIGDLSVTGTLTMNARITTGLSTIDLGETGELSGETPENYIVGNIQTTRNLSAPLTNIAGLGISIDPQSNNLGATTIRRETGTSATEFGIKQVWTISPAAQPTGPVTVTLSWPSTNDNSINLNGLVVFKSGDFGQIWDIVEAVINIDSDPRTATFTITSFSVFTIGESGSLPVELSSFTASATGNEVKLNWSTATESNNSGWEVEQRLTVIGETGLFSNAGFVAGKGTTTEAQTYSFSVSGIKANRAEFRLKQIDMDGKSTYSQILSVDIKPAKFELSQNYPNPFNPSTTIRYSLPFAGKVTMTLYNTLGQKIKTLVQETQAAGFYSVKLNADNLSTGMYFYVLEAGSFKSVKKLMLLK